MPYHLEFLQDTTVWYETMVQNNALYYTMVERDYLSLKNF